MRWFLCSVAFIAAACQTVPPAPTPRPSLVGSEARIQFALSTDVSLGLDRRALDEYRSALSATPRATSQAIEATRIRRLMNETRVLVLEADGPQTRVRVLDGANAGQEGWVYSEVVVPLRSSNSP